MELMYIRTAAESSVYNKNWQSWVLVLLVSTFNNRASVEQIGYRWTEFATDNIGLDLTCPLDANLMLPSNPTSHGNRFMASEWRDAAD